MRQLALLRAINVGGRNSLPMKELVSLFEELGCSEVRTYIQSGNVVFTPGKRPVTAAKLAERIESHAGFAVPVVVRTLAEMAAVAEHSPYPAGEPKLLHVVFLADAPSAKAVASLDPARSPPDRFTVRGREIYLQTPNGLGNSKLTTTWFDSKLSTVSTIRNWRTVLTLLEMMTTPR